MKTPTLAFKVHSFCLGAIFSLLVAPSSISTLQHTLKRWIYQQSLHFRPHSHHISPSHKSLIPCERYPNFSVLPSTQLFVTIAHQLSQTCLFIALGTRVVPAGGLSQSLKNNSSIVSSFHSIEIGSCYITMAVLGWPSLASAFPELGLIVLHYLTID